MSPIITGGLVIEGAAVRQRQVPLGSPPLGTTTAVHAAVADNGSQQVVTTGITNPVVPRNVTATTTGTGANVGAISVVVAGTNAEDAPITETLPAFTAGANGTVVGNKAFKTITSITIPAHAGAGVNTSLGLGAKLGMPFRMSRNEVARAYLGGVLEATPPTVAVSAMALESNTVTLASALNGTAVIVDATPV